MHSSCFLAVSVRPAEIRFPSSVHASLLEPETQAAATSCRPLRPARPQAVVEPAGAPPGVTASGVVSTRFAKSWSASIPAASSR